MADTLIVRTGIEFALQLANKPSSLCIGERQLAHPTNSYTDFIGGKYTYETANHFFDGLVRNLFGP